MTAQSATRERLRTDCFKWMLLLERLTPLVYPNCARYAKRTSPRSDIPEAHSDNLDRNEGKQGAKVRGFEGARVRRCEGSKVRRFEGLAADLSAGALAAAEAS